MSFMLLLCTRLMLRLRCREAGVRNLKKHLEKIYRKAAFKLVQNGAKLVAVEPAAAVAAADAGADKQQQGTEQEPAAAAAADADAAASSADSSSSSSSAGTAAESSSSSSGTTLQVVYEGDPINIGDGDLKEYVGLPPFAQDKFYDTTPAGVVMGLAWTAMGGATLYVEAAPIVDVSGRRAVLISRRLWAVHCVAPTASGVRCLLHARSGECQLASVCLFCPPETPVAAAAAAAAAGL
jgi:Lon-like ATP-dependent protease